MLVKSLQNNNNINLEHQFFKQSTSITFSQYYQEFIILPNNFTTKDFYRIQGNFKSNTFFNCNSFVSQGLTVMSRLFIVGSLTLTIMTLYQETEVVLRVGWHYIRQKTLSRLSFSSVSVKWFPYLRVVEKWLAQPTDLA